MGVVTCMLCVMAIFMSCMNDIMLSWPEGTGKVGEKSQMLEALETWRVAHGFGSHLAKVPVAGEARRVCETGSFFFCTIHTCPCAAARGVAC